MTDFADTTAVKIVAQRPRLPGRRCAFFFPAPGEGATGGVMNHNGQPWDLAPNGKALDQFRITDIKTRIVYNDGGKPAAAPRDMTTYFTSYRQLFVKAGRSATTPTSAS